MKKFFVSTIFITIFIISVIYQRATSINVGPIATYLPAATPTPTASQGKYRDGTYIGSSADASYGTVQVAAVITSGRLADINFLSYPSDRQHSVQVSSYALPILRQEAIAAQSASVDTVSGASYTSAAFIQSLGSALSQAM